MPVRQALGVMVAQQAKAELLAIRVLRVWQGLKAKVVQAARAAREEQLPINTAPRPVMMDRQAAQGVRAVLARMA